MPRRSLSITTRRRAICRNPASGGDRFPDSSATLEMGLERARHRNPERAETALQGVLQGRHRDRRRHHDAGAARQGRVRQICDHVLVVDHAGKPTISGKPPVVGTYRLLRQEIAERTAASTPRTSSTSPAWSSATPICIPRTRPLLRAAALSQQAHRRTALARDLDLRAPAPTST